MVNSEALSDSERRATTDIEPLLAAGEPAALTIKELAEYAGWLHDRQLAPASLARHLVSLKLFFRYLQLEGALTDNLAELLGSQKLWQRVPEVLPPTIIDRMLEGPVAGPGQRRGRPLAQRQRLAQRVLQYSTHAALAPSFLNRSRNTG